MASKSLQPVSLERGLGLVSATSIVAGAVIGSGIFLVASDIAQVLSSPVWIVAVWVAAGVISMMGGLILAELGAAFPGSGGPYLYLSQAFHPLAGFLNGWSISLIVQPGSIAAVAVAFAEFSASLLPIGAGHTKVVASITVVILTAINLWGLQAGAEVNNVLTALKVLSILGIGVFGCLAPAVHPGAFQDLTGATASGFGVALIAAFWAYDGWNNITYIAGEVSRPQRNIPLSLIIGIGMVVLLYGLTNVAYLRFLTPAQIAVSPLPAADAARMLGGEWAVRAILIAVILSTLGCWPIPEFLTHPIRTS
jgi:APA family basic amino acid/polyamine antiporter